MTQLLVYLETELATMKIRKSMSPFCNFKRLFLPGGRNTVMDGVQSAHLD